MDTRRASRAQRKFPRNFLWFAGRIREWGATIECVDAKPIVFPPDPAMPPEPQEVLGFPQGAPISWASPSWASAEMGPFDGRKLRQRRLLKGWSQEELATRVGVDVRAVRNAELGKNRPRPFNQRAYADALGCRVEDLLGPGPAILDEPLRGDDSAGSRGEDRARARGLSHAATRQLRDPPATFMGRSHELSTLEESIGRGIRALCISGLAGSGKTALASALCERISARFPDGQLYIDLRGASGAISPANAMRHVLWSLYPNTPVIEDDVKVVSAYRSALRGKRVLLMLDDAASADQLEPLLPPPAGCLAIVTSRTAVVLEGVSSLLLGMLGPEEARKLLRSTSAMSGTTIDAIADLCGGMPLALVLMARALAGTDVDPGELLAALADVQRSAASAHPLAGVDASLHHTYAQLPELERGLFARLCVCSGDFDRPALCAVWDLPEAKCSETLSALCRMHLVEHVSGRGAQARYKLHDLVRDFAARQLPPEERAATERRHAAYFQGMLERADEDFRAGGASQTRALATLDRERIGIEHAFRTCLREDADPELRELGSRLCRVPLLELRQSARTRATRCELALDRESSQDPTRRAALLERLATAQRDLGGLEDAARSYHEALALVAGRGAPRIEAAALLGLGITTYYRGQAREAGTWLQRSLELATSLGDGHLELRTLRSLGIAAYLTGELREAQRLQVGALERARAREDRAAEAQCLIALAHVERQLGKPEDACEHCDQALPLAAAAGSKVDRLQAQICLAFAWAARGDLERAAPAALESVDLARALGDRRAETMALGACSVCAALAGDLAASDRYSLATLQGARTIGDRYCEGWALGTRARALLASEKHDEARDVLREWLELARRIHDRRGEAVASWQLGLLIHASGHPEAGLEPLEACLRYEEEMEHGEAPKHRSVLESLRSP
jgi:transcriptional regulator with XRE-family HTH domain/tetratricopeptide (TPR) repeat protein